MLRDPEVIDVVCVLHNWVIMDRKTGAVYAKNLNPEMSFVNAHGSGIVAVASYITTALSVYNAGPGLMTGRSCEMEFGFTSIFHSLICTLKIVYDENYANRGNFGAC